jgi:DNA helicase-2/ATP-dependent DNA helicase PcrA
MSSLLANLNEPQLAAVTLPPQHALILAGAGSGKTRVLTTRIAWLISTHQASPHGVLAVTFTNKAAREMQTRLSAMLPINPRGMWIGTFHGLCNRLLRAHHRDAGLPHAFQILDSQDQLAAIKRLLKTLNVDDEKFPPRNLQHFINGAKEDGRRAARSRSGTTMAGGVSSCTPPTTSSASAKVWSISPSCCCAATSCCHATSSCASTTSTGFRHVLVDEFQDTNNLQYKWLKLMAGGGASVFAVGDDDQSIYAFRGANVGNMAAFEREFQVPNLIKLEQNYRSHGTSSIAPTR